MRRASGSLLLAAASFLPGCGDPPPPTGTGGGGPAFVYARGKDSPGLDPAQETDGESALVLVNVYDTLVQYRLGSATELEPALATRWESSPDHRTMTFTLREGVRFHDGRPLDAEAVVANFERQRDPAHRFRMGGSYPYWQSMFQSVSRTVAAGPSTVRFEFSEPAPPFFLHLLAMFSASIVSPGALGRGSDFVARNPVGTGAFRFASWEADEITLEANPEWWGGRPRLGRLSFVVVPDVRTAYVRLETGALHGVDNLDAQDVARARGNPAVTVHEVPGMNVCYLAMNNEVAPFDDARVRRAVGLAIDKDRIVSAAYDGLAIPARTLVPPTIEGHAALPPRARDLEEAKRLLREAGKAGARVTLSFPSNVRPYMPRPQVVAMQIREDLLAIGLDVVLRKEEWAPYLKRLANAEHEMGLIGWSADVADADNFLYVLLDKDSAKKGESNNYAFYRSEPFHEAVLAARRTYDPAERRALYERAQRIADEDVPVVPLVHTPQTAATRSNVKGFVIDPVTRPRFFGVTVE